MVRPGVQKSIQVMRPICLRSYGREVRTLVNPFQKADKYSTHFDTKSLSSGVYFYKLIVGNSLITTKKNVIFEIMLTSS